MNYSLFQGDDKNAAAPRLGGVLGRQTGSTNYPSSKALKGAGFKWSDKHLFMYLLNPGKYIPGNKMSFAGLASEADRANLIAYIK
jgi:cytochrome c